MSDADLIVVGGGAAGLHTALTAADLGASVNLVARKALSESSSYWAQGGLAAAIGDDDSPELHVDDTLTAGRACCRRSAAETLAAEAPGKVEELEGRGVEFDRDAEGRLALSLEGGHSRRRVVHAGGAGTGRRITETLASLAADEERISVSEQTSVTALWSDGERCHGVVTETGTVRAPATVLATGGAAALWSRTTNPWGAIGAGLVMAEAAGAELADLELCQFHPTALAAPGSEKDGLLITEAVRGEGATLLDSNGERFTDELAPRDEVTLAILERMEQTAADHVLIDLREIDEGHFPNIFEALREAGADPAEPVPVAPASHYVMGGIATDGDGRSSLEGLFAVGECACTGLHGANRLASNSLSECFVLGSRAAAAASATSAPSGGAPEPSDWRFTPPDTSTREAVWRDAGPLRTTEGLERLLDDPYPLARLIARFALERAESRGSHHRLEFPHRDPGFDQRHLVLDAGGDVAWRTW